jgi:myo-inositol catabolism protein IolS
MKYRTLGGTGLKVSVIGLGTHQFSGEWAKQFTKAEVKQLLERGHELGINLIDTAECYGDHTVERLVGESIQQKRQDWVLATKFGHAYRNDTQKVDAWSAGEVLQQLEASLKALRTDYIDLYQFHSGSNEVFKSQELWTMLDKQVSAGKIKHLGISLGADLVKNNNLEQLYSAPKVKAGFVQVLYNRLFKHAESEVFPFCQKNQIGVLARVPLAKGFLSGVYRPGTKFSTDDVRSGYSQTFNDEQLALVERIKQEEVPPGENMAQWALAWCLKNPTVSCVVVGCKNISQLELNAAASRCLTA